MLHLYFRRGSDNCGICSRNWNEAENNKTCSMKKKKNEGHEYILKDLSFQYSDCLPEKEFAYKQDFLRTNISVVEEEFCYHYFFNLAEKNKTKH